MVENKHGKLYSCVRVEEFNSLHGDMYELDKISNESHYSETNRDCFANLDKF